MSPSNGNAVDSQKFGSLLSQDIEEAKNDTSMRLATEVMPDQCNSSDDEQF